MVLIGLSGARSREEGPSCCGRDPETPVSWSELLYLDQACLQGETCYRFPLCLVDWHYGNPLITPLSDPIRSCSVFLKILFVSHGQFCFTEV